MNTQASEPFTVTRYRCPHCRRTWATRARAEVHIAKCWYNHGCKTCRHADLLGGSYVDGCQLGEDLSDPDEPQRIVPRGQCPLWEATP